VRVAIATSKSRPERTESLHILGISHTIAEGSSISHYCVALSEIHTIPRFHKKKLHYNQITLNSNNKMKSTWEIRNEGKGKTKHGMYIQSLVTHDNVIMNQNNIANTLNNHFLCIADSCNSDNNKHIRGRTVK